MTTVPPAASLTRRLMRLSTVGEVVIHDNDDDPMGRWLEVSMTTREPTPEVMLTVKLSELSIAGIMPLTDSSVMVVANPECIADEQDDPVERGP